MTISIILIFFYITKNTQFLYISMYSKVFISWKDKTKLKYKLVNFCSGFFFGRGKILYNFQFFQYFSTADRGVSYPKSSSCWSSSKLSNKLNLSIMISSKIIIFDYKHFDYKYLLHSLKMIDFNLKNKQRNSTNILILHIFTKY